MTQLQGFALEPEAAAISAQGLLEHISCPSLSSPRAGPATRSVFRPHSVQKATERDCAASTRRAQCRRRPHQWAHEGSAGCDASAVAAGGTERLRGERSSGEQPGTTTHTERSCKHTAWYETRQAAAYNTSGPGRAGQAYKTGVNRIRCSSAVHWRTSWIGPTHCWGGGREGWRVRAGKQRGVGYDRFNTKPVECRLRPASGHRSSSQIEGCQGHD